VGDPLALSHTSCEIYLFVEVLKDILSIDLLSMEQTAFGGSIGGYCKCELGMKWEYEHVAELI
jgi:hypothetical protein